MLRRYLKDTSGNFATLYAVATFAILAGVGAAIDYSGVTKSKTYIQDLADAGALAAALSQEKSETKLKKIAVDYIAELNDTDTTVSADLKVVNDVIVVETQTVYNTYLMGIFGQKTVDVAAVAQSPIGDETPISLALVLDRTGSMNGSNMTALKSASRNMIKTFETNKANIKASVVPFAQYVNVGTKNRYATWMDVPADGSTTGDEVCRMKRDLINPGACTMKKVKKTCYNDGIAFSCTKVVKQCPSSAYGPKYEKCYIPTTTVKWHGCAGSRNTPLNKTPHYNNKKIPGIMNVKCGEEMLPLTTNMKTVENKIKSLTSSGNTYIPSGLIWGWRTLESSQPFNDITSADPKRKKVMVLMTDGKNTKSLNGNDHTGSNENAANSLTTEICNGIKNNEIEVYTVAYKFASGDATAKNVVKNCASNTANFFDAQNAQQLEEAFDNIAKSLLKIRLSA